MSTPRSPSSTPKPNASALPELGTTIQIPSTLSPHSTPTSKSTVPLPLSDDVLVTTPSSPGLRIRAVSGLTTLTAPTLAPLPLETSSLSLPASFEADGLGSTFRNRSKSPGRASDRTEAEGSPNLWAEQHVSRRPWYDTPKKKRSVPQEQTEAFYSTRTKVAQATASALELGAGVLHEALYIGVDLLQLAPVPGLKEAAATLLNIWDAVQQVDMYRLLCLRLTERCADMLISIRHEVADAGDVVGEELVSPIAKLEESYLSVHRFMLKQVHRPWLKRYLKRDEILKDIAACDNNLHDALSLFNVSIQIRILKQIQESERKRQAELQTLAASILRGRLPLLEPNTKMILGSETHDTTTEPVPGVSTDYSTETVLEFSATTNSLGLTTDPEEIRHSPEQDLKHSDVIPAIHSIHEAQNSLDTARDLTDLRHLMRAALQAGSDAEMVEVLQIKRQEMPDAIKALQRALERLTERDGGTDQAIGKGVVVGKVVKRVSLHEQEGQPGLKRSTTILSLESSSSSGDSTSGTSSETKRRDTLDSEFIESGIDALWRMSHGFTTTVPSWTITKFEVDRDEKIGIGFFSDVYKGTWRGRTVAIKVLAESTPRKLFVREIGIWKTLRHPNVLPLYGASSAIGDPPWFFVSPYLKNGTLVEYLKKIDLEVRPSGLGVGTNSSQSVPASPYRSPGGKTASLPAFSKFSSNGDSRPQRSSASGSAPPMSRTTSRDSPIQREWDLFRFVHEIAKGMAYLHSNGVLHGDLKASNVLVDDKYRAIISDFGQSEMKSEAYRISGTSPPHGTLRWQSPELMAGESQLTAADDVWAFSITCVEILNMGRMPWPLMDDNAVRHFVMKDNSRPSIPRNSRFNTPGLQDILRVCWSTNPKDRPPFSKISRDLKLLRKSTGQDIFDSPKLPPIEDVPENPPSPSPDMRPLNLLPQFLQGESGSGLGDILGSLNPGPETTSGTSPLPVGQTNFERSHRESTVGSGDMSRSEIVIFTPGHSQPPSRSSSMLLEPSHAREHLTIVDLDGYESPPPIDERAGHIKNERRYRLLLTHDYHPSLTLPLWSPTPVELGAVGYLSKPKGEFITFFNAYSPSKASHTILQKLPSIEGYGRPAQGSHRQDTRTVTQKALDLIYGGSLTFRNSSKQVSRRYLYPLKAGHKVAYLCTEITQYDYIESLDAPKKWFQLHADTVMQAYGHEHQIQKEDLLLVIGALRVPNYGLFVSHSHPEGHVHFSVYSSQKSGQPWGTFTTDADVARDAGPSYDSDELEVPRVSASKVSIHGDPWAAVLLARLRFKPDAVEPTSK